MIMTAMAMPLVPDDTRLVVSKALAVSLARDSAPRGASQMGVGNGAGATRDLTGRPVAPRNAAANSPTSAKRRWGSFSDSAG